MTLGLAEVTNERKRVRRFAFILSDYLVRAAHISLNVPTAEAWADDEDDS